jgi:hypothetical protein
MTHPPTPKTPKALKIARFLTWLLEHSIRIPFTKKRIGLDGVIGLIPLIGDALPVIFTLYLMALGLYYKAPLSLLAKMMVIGIIDVFIGTITGGVGDFLDVLFKSHKINMDLLENYLQQPSVTKPPSQEVIDVDIKTAF